MKILGFITLALILTGVFPLAERAQTDEKSGVYNVKTALAAGDGVTDDAKTVDALVNKTLAVKGGEIYFPQTAPSANTDYLINSNLVFPANVRLRFAPGARLKVADGVTVTLAEAPAAAGRRQIFKLVGTGRVIFAAQITALPQWWGARDDAAQIKSGTVTGTDDTAAVQAALDALNASGGGTLDVRAANGFVIGGGLKMDNFLNVRLLGNAGQNNGTRGSVNLVFTGAPAVLISANYIFNVRFERVGFFYTNAKFTGDMLRIGDGGIGDPQNDGINGCSFGGRDFQNGFEPTANSAVKLRHAINAVIEESSFYNTKYGIVNDGYANVVAVKKNVFAYTESYPINLTGGAESWNITDNTFEGGSNNSIGKGLTRALKIVGSAWAVNFSNNWLGDGTAGAAGGDPMVAAYNVYGLTIDNNRFANYGGTKAYGILLDGCQAVSVRSNRFEYMPPVNTTITKGYTYRAVFESNDWNSGENNLGGVIGATQFDGENNFVGGGLIVNGGGGSNTVGANTSAVGFGTVYKTVDDGQNGRAGGGIRMTSAVAPFNDGSMIFTTRRDIAAAFSFWNGTEIWRMDANGIAAFKPFKFGAGVNFDRTLTARGTVGAQKIDKPNGRVNFAAGAVSLVVTDALVAATSSIIAVAQANDAACAVKNVVPGTGTFTINMTAKCAAETPVAFWVFN